MITRTKLYSGVAAIALAAAAVIGYQAFPRGASAGQGGALDDGKDLLPKATVTLSQAPANPADLKGTIRWAKPSPKTGPNMDTVQFAMRPPGR